MNFFESQLRRLFGDTEDARFIGRCCFIPADDGNLVKAEFVTQGVHEEYVALQMSVINRADGVIDKTLLRFGDYFSRNSRGQTPYIRCDSGKPCAMQPPIMSSPSLRISEWEVCDVKSFENQISGYVRRYRWVPNGTHECRRFFYAGRLVRKRQTRAESLSVTIRNGRRILLR